MPVAGRTTITLDVVPVTRGKEPVPVLSQSNLQVLDNGHPVAITSFAAPSPATRLAVILVLDAVNANYTSIAFQRTELEKFFPRTKGILPSRPRSQS